MKVDPLKASPTLCVFANFRIDNEERLQRMRDSFYSFCDVMPNEWRINIRGCKKLEAAEFIRSNIRAKVFISHKESRRGWFKDSLDTIDGLTSEFVFFWIEDHICISDISVLRGVIEEMSLHCVDQLIYSWFPQHWRTHQVFPVVEVGNYIDVRHVNPRSVSEARKVIGYDFYVISAVSLMRTQFFVGLLKSGRPRLRRWSRFLPFDFEKRASDIAGTVFKIAMPQKELFVAIDDDHHETGYCLISRGLYPGRMQRSGLKDVESLGPSKSIGFLKVLFPRSVRILLRRVAYTLRIC